MMTQKWRQTQKKRVTPKPNQYALWDVEARQRSDYIVRNYREILEDGQAEHFWHPANENENVWRVYIVYDA